MGLSGRKVKQRIGNDPRNLSWADDAARFGSNYLSKFGWDPSKGLGVGEEGRTSHVKVAQKLDMMGIGAAHQADPNGIAWKQNKDFENLLKRLNQANGDPDGGDTEDGGAAIVMGGFVQQKGKLEGEKKKAKDGKEEDSKNEGREKNDKKLRVEDGDKLKDKDAGEKKKKRKGNKSDADKKSKKKRKKDNRNISENTEQDEPSQAPPPTIERKTTRVVPRHRSHRARHIAAKSLASKSAVAISEILGIAPTPSLSSSGTQLLQETKLTSIYDNSDDSLEMSRITTSTKSLEDYFKSKFNGLKESTVSAAATGARLETAEVDYDDVPRGGLGSRPKQAVSGVCIGPMYRSV